MAAIKVKSFRATWSNWDIGWRWHTAGKSTIRLPVKFRLELEAGSSNRDCMVGQMKRGKMSDASGIDTFTDWEMDGPIGHFYWWDGDTMSTAGFGEWNADGLVATFEDAPGFHRAKGPFYMGDSSGKGYFEFKTVVVKRDLTALAEILWWMRIDVPNPGKGGLWWSYSNQK
jgi:hypothetical protein